MPVPLAVGLAIAAILATLAAAVLGPIVARRLQRPQPPDETRKSREARLRRMLVAHMAMVARTITDMEAQFLLEEVTGTSQKSADRTDEHLDTLPLWEPHRISDHKLKQMANEYHARAVELDRDLLTSPPQEDSTQRRARRRRMASELHSLEIAITTRMDELNWAEEDD